MKKRTNVIILLLTTSVIISCSFVNKDKRKPLIKLIIEKVDLEIETPFKISCVDYNSYFKNGIKNKVIVDQKKLLEFSELVESLKADPENYTPDVRCKMLLVYENKVDTLCLSRLGIALNGNAMVFDENVINYIKE